MIELKKQFQHETTATRAAACGSRACTLGLSLFLAFVVLAPVVAQETGQKPDAPAPKIGQITNPPPKMPLLAKPASEPDTLRDVSELAAEILEYAAAASCRKSGCTILVTDFVLPEGFTSPYGMQSADELSKELARRGKEIQVIDRKVLHDLLTKDRVSASSMNEGLARSIAFALKATHVVLGTTKKIGSDEVQLSTRLLEVANKDWSGYDAAVDLLVPKSIFDLSPIESLESLPPITTSLSGENVFRAGVDGVSSPACFYMPNPPYSEEARRFKVDGAALAKAVINPKGNLENPRIVYGLPVGLNETTIATMKTWICSPALKDGKPIATLARFEVNFRLY